MLTCVPQSLCLWDYRVLGTSGGPAALTFNFFTEQGSIGLGDAEFTVCQAWPHERALDSATRRADARRCPPSRVRCSARSSCRFTTSISPPRAQSAFTRCYDILSGDRHVGTIQPMHALTRRACIKYDRRFPSLPNSLRSGSRSLPGGERRANSAPTRVHDGGSVRALEPIRKILVHKREAAEMRKERESRLAAILREMPVKRLHQAGGAGGNTS